MRTMRTKIACLWIADTSVIALILLNATVLFLDAFPGVHAAAPDLLFWIDYACLIYFIVEAAIKINQPEGFRGYWGDSWNKFDFMIVALSLPLLVSPIFSKGLEDVAIVMLLRLGRLLRFARVMRSVPQAEKIWKGVTRALRASIAVFLVLFVLNIILAMGASLLFGDIPQAEEFFGDPIKSLYSLFKVFTIEGWYEIPDAMASRGVSAGMVLLLRFYFTLTVLAGGLLGLSIANAVFVDSMVSDNTDEVERMVSELQQDLREFREEFRRGERQ